MPAVEAVEDRSSKTPLVAPPVSTEVEEIRAREPVSAITEVVWAMFKPIPVVKALTEIFSAIPVVSPEPVTATKPLDPVMVPEEVTFKPVPVVRPLAVTVKTPVGVVTELAVMVTALVEPAPAN